ncbi:MAG: iron chelate uptake ABC transporter family permease subunit, partial [Gammaproteobacteria bacterium]|nr:iron chelate uptake ABC transporter family permease subunit [Gammaproteobacteria bacterium]
MTSRQFTAALVLASIIAVVAACTLGSTPMGFSRVVAAFFGQSSPADSVVIWQIRLPRALSAFVVGAALGASGAA